MKKLLFFALLWPLFSVAHAQNAETTPAAKPAAVDSVIGTYIEYDIIRRIDGQNVKVMVVTDGGGGGGGQEPEVSMPSTINQTQNAGFTDKGAWLSEPQMPMPKLPNMPEGADLQRMIVKPVTDVFGMDFAKRQLAQLMTSEHDPEKKTYYAPKDLTTPKDWKEGKKTKKIAGYECKKATCTLDDLEYTLWITTEIEGAFSPKSDLFPPDKGVVLAFESDDLSYTAKTVTLKTKVPPPAIVPADAVKLTPDEMKAKRREFYQKAMPAGGMIRMQRN